jgi:hypothetical protein
MKDYSLRGKELVMEELFSGMEVTIKGFSKTICLREKVSKSLRSETEAKEI